MISLILKTRKKRNFIECELEALLYAVEAQKTILFGTLLTGVTNKRKRTEWESVCESVNESVNVARVSWPPGHGHLRSINIGFH